MFQTCKKLVVLPILLMFCYLPQIIIIRLIIYFLWYKLTKHYNKIGVKLYLVLSAGPFCITLYIQRVSANNPAIWTRYETDGTWQVIEKIKWTTEAETSLDDNWGYILDCEMWTWIIVYISLIAVQRKDSDLVIYLNQSNVHMV